MMDLPHTNTSGKSVVGDIYPLQLLVGVNKSEDPALKGLTPLLKCLCYFPSPSLFGEGISFLFPFSASARGTQRCMLYSFCHVRTPLREHKPFLLALNTAKYKHIVF